LGESTEGTAGARDSHTKTYMERLTEVTARLTVSDNEGDFTTRGVKFNNYPLCAEEDI